MSFYPQPNKYQCGPFALKHALVMLGIFKKENDIGIIAGSTWWAGTDEIGLARAARNAKCKMKYFHSSNSTQATKLLNHELKQGYPCILSVKNWEHWLTVINNTKGKYIVIDSELDKVISIQSPSQLLKSWRYQDEETKALSYDGYALYPNFRITTRAKITLEKAKILMYERNSGLAKKWDQYFNDLINICKPRTNQMLYFITFSEFLRRHERTLIRRISHWHGEPEYNELKKILQNMEFVAEIYDLIIPFDEEKKALIDLSSILMMYSCGKYGMDPLY